MKKFIPIIANICFVMFGFKVTAQTTNGAINTLLNSATINYSGTAVQLIPNSTTFTSHGVYNLVINNPAGVSSAGNTYLNVSGTLTLTSGTFTTASSIYLANGISVGGGQIQSGNYIIGFYGSAASQTIPVNAFVNSAINVLYINNTSTGATVTTSGNLSVPTTLALQHGTLALGGTLNIGGTITYTAGGISASSDTVTFNGSSAQTVPVGTFITNTVNNLGVANAAGLSFSGPITFGSLTLANLGTVPALTDAGQTTVIDGPLVINSFSSTPASGQSFIIDTAGTVSGTFSSLTLPSGYTGSMSYTSRVAKLTIASVPVLSLNKLVSPVNKTDTIPVMAPTIFSIYPNPATGSQVTLLHKQAVSGSIIKISTLYGKLISVTNVADGETNTALDVSKLQSGLYIVNFYNNGKVNSIRLLK